jgi:hypothetical protein
MARHAAKPLKGTFLLSRQARPDRRSLAPSRRRQDKPERRALAEPALDLQRRPDPFGEFAAQQQAEAGAAFASKGAPAFEPEQARDLRLAHADAGIGDDEGDAVAIDLSRQRYRCARGGEFQRIGEEIAQDRGGGVFLREDADRARADFEPHALGGGGLLKGAPARLEQSRHSDRRRLGERVHVQARPAQQALHQPMRLMGGFVYDGGAPR